MCIIGFCALIFSIEKINAQNVQSIKNQKPIEIRGALSANVQFYESNGIANRRQPLTWFLTGAPTLKVYGMTFPFTFTVSEQERRFSQPFNQYGVSPYYKWIKLHLGYRNVRFGDFTLAGANFLGAGVELTPGKLRLGFVYGQFARPIEEDSSRADPRYRYLRPTYQRLGWGGKVGFGSAKSFLDVSVFKAHDVIGSIRTPSRRSRIMPMENLAVSIKNHFGLFKQKLRFDFEVAGSALTRNIANYDVETEQPALNALLNIMAVNSSTAFFTAARGNATYQFKRGNVSLQYQRVDPDYQSLGAYFFQNDVEQITLSPSFVLLKNRLTVSASYGLSHDNLKGKKAATTHRNVGSINLNASINKNLNASLSYSNFGVGQSRGLGDLFNDSLAVSVVNSSYSGSVNYRRGNRSRQQTFSLMAIYQSTNDQNQFTRQFTGASSFVTSLNYGYNDLTQKWSANGSISYVLIETAGRQLTNMGPSLSISKEWWKGKFRTTFNHNSQARLTDGLNDGLMSNTGLNTTIAQKRQSLGLSANYLYNRYKASADALTYRNFAEYRGTISYGIRF